MALTGQVVTEKINFNIQFVTDLWPSQEMTLTFNTRNTSLTQHVVCIYQFSGHRLQNFLKNLTFSLFSIEKPM